MKRRRDPSNDLADRERERHPGDAQCIAQREDDRR